MSNDAMLKRAKEVVVDYFNERVEKTDNRKITEDDVFIVWFCKTLQNWKALVSTTIFYKGLKMEWDKTETAICRIGDV